MERRLARRVLDHEVLVWRLVRHRRGIRLWPGQQQRRCQGVSAVWNNDKVLLYLDEIVSEASSSPSAERRLAPRARLKDTNPNADNIINEIFARTPTRPRTRTRSCSSTSSKHRRIRLLTCSPMSKLLSGRVTASSGR